MDFHGEEKICKQHILPFAQTEFASAARRLAGRIAGPHPPEEVDLDFPDLFFQRKGYGSRLRLLAIPVGAGSSCRGIRNVFGSIVSQIRFYYQAAWARFM
jgi:hypothetical protein